MTLYRKVFTKDRLPDKDEWYYTEKGLHIWSNKLHTWASNMGKENPYWFMEEIELPTEEEIYNDINELPYDDDMYPNDIGIQGVNYILNKLKG